MPYAVAVFCGSEPTSPRSEEYLALAEETGKLIAGRGMQLLTGAGPGLMEAAARGASMAGGSVKGVALAAFGSSSSKYVHEVTEHQDLGERQSTLLGAADAYIALPGGPGTLYEVAQVLACKRVHQIDIKKPLVLVGPFFKTLLAFLDEIVHEGFSGPELPKYYVHVGMPEEAVAYVATHASG